MVRRAEYALGKAIRAGQEKGEVRTRTDGGSLRSSVQLHADDMKLSKPGPADFASQSELSSMSGGIYDLVDDVSSDQFEEALSEARDEDNLSRANVVLPPPMAPLRDGGWLDELADELDDWIGLPVVEWKPHGISVREAEFDGLWLNRGVPPLFICADCGHPEQVGQGGAVNDGGNDGIESRHRTRSQVGDDNGSFGEDNQSSGDTIITLIADLAGPPPDIRDVKQSSKSEQYVLRDSLGEVLPQGGNAPFDISAGHEHIVL